MICHSCEVATLKLGTWIHEQPSNAYLSKSPPVKLHSSLKDLWNSVESACQLCCFIYEGIPKGASKILTKSLPLHIQDYTIEDGAANGLLVASFDTFNVVLELHQVNVTEEITSLLNNSASPLDMSTGSEISLAFASYWLQQCRSTHSSLNCPAQRNKPYLPRRVIDVGLNDYDHPRLVETNRDIPATDYIALSHCWGSSQNRPLTTTRATLAKRCERIELATMPLTFQHSIRVARQLRIPYLWIDSLCVLQDSAEDWESESVEMASIFHDATLTIFASHGADSSTGCFVTRDGLRSRPCLLEALNRQPIPHSFLPSWPIFVFPRKGLRPWTIEPDAILDRRAWVLQEDLLSLRKLIFDKNEVRWQCPSLAASQRAVVPELNRFSIHLPRPQREHFSPLLSMIRGTGRGPDLQFSNTKLAACWHELVVEYSRRLLSHPTDRLAAIAGIAQVIQRFTGFTYMAGIWQELWWDNILWYKPVTYFEQIPTQRESERQRVAPTWSWASLKAPSDIEFWSRHFHPGPNYPTWPDPIGYFCFRRQCKLVNTELYGSSFNVRGSLILQGQLTVGQLPSPRFDPAWPHWEILVTHSPEKEPTPSCSFWPEVNEVQDTTVYLLTVATATLGRGYGPLEDISICLVLVPRRVLHSQYVTRADDIKLYQRIGLAEFNSEVLETAIQTVHVE